MKKLFVCFALAMLICLTAFAAPDAVDLNDTALQQPENDNEELFCSVQLPELASYIPYTSEAELSNDDDIYAYLAERLMKSDKEINVEIYEIDVREAKRLADYYTIALWMYPELYNVVHYFDYYYSKNTNCITRIVPKYSETDKTKLATVRAEINAQLDSIIANTNSSMTDIEKLLTVYDSVVMSVYYDDTLEKTTAKELLLDGTAVCQGYASTFYALATKLGIECGFVESDEMNHVWNVVKLDGAWYHVDMTWDDTIYKDSMRATHNYFLKSNDWFLSSDGGHYGFTAVNGDSDLYDSAYWNNAVSKINFTADCAYFVGNSGSISCYDKQTKSITSIYSFADNWPSATAGFYWLGTFAGLDVYKERLYFNTNNQIKSCKFDGSDVITEYELPTASNQSIYGCYIKKSRLYYALGEKSNVSEITGIGQLSLLKPGEQVAGDINLDEDVDINDAILLFQYSMMSDVYQLEYVGNIDYTKDGAVDIDDAIYLFQYSMMGTEFYPIE